VRTLIDVGGQDAKAMLLAPDGRVENFVMNDKCAAGTGRFLEVMARVLDVELSVLADLDLEAAAPARISSTCTVFAESEVISQLASGADAHALAAGIALSVATQTASLAKRAGVEPPVCMTGGVAKNGGVVRALERLLGTTVSTSPRSQLAGAIGAALLALESIENSR
jgi:predicted CoA-substrate-specific enzyme activase